jgi:hypothetical protein
MLSAIANSAPFGTHSVAISSLANPIASVTIPIFLLALSFIPGCLAKRQPTFEPGPKPESPYVKCFEGCLEAKTSPVVTMLCQLACAIFAKKQPGEL